MTLVASTPVFIGGRARSIGMSRLFLDSFLTNMEATAPLAAVDGQAIALANVTRRSVPEVQRDAMLVRCTAIVVERLAACGIRARKNQLRSVHRESTSRPVCVNLMVVGPREVSSLTEFLRLNRDGSVIGCVHPR